MLENSTGRYFAYFAGASWLRTAWMVVLLLVAGLVEGIGLAALLPIIEIVISESPDQTSRVSLLVVSGLASIGIPATLLSLLLVIIGAMTLKGILRWFAHRAAGFMTTEVAKELRVDLIEALLRARWQFFVARPAGHVATAVGGEAQRAAMGFQEGCAALAGLIQVAVYAIFAAIISWKVALAAVVAGGLVILLLRRLVSAARSAGRDQTQLMRSLVVHLTDSLTSLKPVKAMARESDLRQLLERDAEKFRDAQRRQISANLSMVAFQEPIMMVFLAIGLYVAIQYSGMPFSTVLLLGFLFFRVAASVNRSQYRYQAMSTGEGAFYGLLELTEQAKSYAESSAASTRFVGELRQGISFRDVSLAYGSRRVLEDVSFDIPANKFVAFVGASGVGKTTIADLLTGLLETDAGTILIDGTPITRVEIQSWRRTLGYVPQEVILLHDTIRRNIALGNTGVTDADLEYALQAAGALQFVQRLPNGLDQVVGERGMALSGGQRQRISIARAMLNRPQLLILDEPTTALDPDSEQAICETLRGLKGSVTIVAISHQSAIQAVADIVFKVHEGRVYPYDNQRHALPAEDCGERRTMSPDLEEILEGFDD